MTAYYYSSGKQRAPALLVLLPGVNDSPFQFENNGFIRLAREHSLAADMVAVDAHMGYYLDGTIADRLDEDIVAPAVARGYDAIWFVGASLGGYGALVYAATHPGVVKGIVLIAPYLGARGYLSRIDRIEFLDRIDTSAFNRYDRKVWQWLHDYRANGWTSPALYLGYGAQDRYATTHRLLATALDPDKVVTLDGGHDWTTWRALWSKLLDRIALNSGFGDSD